MLAAAAAGSVLELGGIVHLSFRLCFFIPWEVLFLLLFVVMVRYAAIFSLLAASVLIPMAHIKPSNSRPTAVTILR